MRRAGDTRPLRNPAGRVTEPMPGPTRWLPQHGDPFCLLEWLSQSIVKLIAYLPVYVAIVVTITLVFVLVAR